jgi:diguanylate cyclase (GGDEF)-like protein/PAS domain S-box-containing protein
VADDNSLKNQGLDKEISAILKQISRDNPLNLSFDSANIQNQANTPFRILFDIINQAALLFMLGDDHTPGPCLEANSACFLHFGFSRQELIGENLNDIIQLKDEAKLLALQEHQVENHHVVLKRRSNKQINATAYFTKLELGKGSNYLLCVLDAHSVKSASGDSELCNNAFDHMTQALAITDSRGVMIKVNRAFSEITGFESNSAIGRTLKVRAPEKAQQDQQEQIWKSAMESGSWQGPVLYHHRSEGERVVWLDLTVIRNGSDQPHFLASMLEMGDRGVSKETLVHQAHHDPLTGLPNRVLFNDRLKQALAQAKRRKCGLALLFMDIDNFKTINESLNHAVGDAYLQKVASRLVSCMRDQDTVSRLGGDEFVIILPDMGETDNVIQVANRIISAMNKPVICEGHELVMSVSIGITIFPNDGTDPETLVKNADMAMYRAKEQGKRTYQLYNPAMHAKVRQRLVMESNLRKAFERNEFVVHYQPKMCITTGKVVGMEALIRWMRPKIGMVSPAKFIPLAEETGLIVPIGEWVLREAAKFNKSLNEQGYDDFVVSVNLSSRQFLWQHDLVEMLVSVLEDSGLEPEKLDLELTESVVMHNVEGAIATMNKLHAMGVSLSLDDFGTGYSSMQYLKQFPIDYLKIDQSFVRGIPDLQEDTAIVKSIISMAHTLKLQVVAEGVEYVSQHEFLAANGCDMSQGYLYSKPVSLDEFQEFVQSNQSGIAIKS